MRARHLRPVPLRRLLANRGGTALIEFAMVLPVVLMLYLGSIQLQDGYSCSRKVTIAARELADLIAQNGTDQISAANLDDALAASLMVLAPYAKANATVRISQVRTDPLLRTKVEWSRAENGPAYVKNSYVDVPQQMKVPQISFLWAEVTYKYVPPAFLGIKQPIIFKDHLVMLPRNVDAISCGDC